MVYTIRLQRYRDKKILVCDEDSTPSGPIGSAVLTFIEYKQTKKSNEYESLYIN